jgi:hypothetical protein
VGSRLEKKDEGDEERYAVCVSDSDLALHARNSLSSPRFFLRNGVSFRKEMATFVGTHLLLLAMHG